MNSLAEKITTLFAKDSRDVLRDASFDFVRSPAAIMRELLISKQTGNFLGVYSRALGEGMFLTRVEKIESQGQTQTVVFFRNDMSGHLLPRTRISIDEIHMVCPFSKLHKTSSK